MSIDFRHNAENPKHLIIFVHGLGGDKKSFQNEKDMYFHYYFNEKIKNCCDIGYFEYTTNLFSSKFKSFFSNLFNSISHKFNKEITEISELLRTDCLNYLSKYDTINFVCHSMGGLIVKDLLTSKDIPFDKKNFYITLATPHQGSDVANKVVFINGIHPQIKDLKTDSKLLLELNKEFKYQKEQYNRKYYYASHDTIVTKQSSCSEDDEQLRLAVEGNHISICKPTNETASTLLQNINQTISEYLELGINDTAYLNNEEEKDNLLESDAKSLDLAALLFDSYHKNYQDYYFSREIDQEIKKILTIKNIWISGVSGVGKTNIAQFYGVGDRDFFHSTYFISSEKCEQEYLTLIYQELRDCISDKSFTINESLQINKKIAKVLCYLSDKYSSITLHFDELSDIGEEKVQLFLIALVDILTNQRGTCDLKNVNIIITTIFNPEDYLCSMKGKSHYYDKVISQFEFIKLQEWDSKDLKGLYSLISSHFGDEIEIEEFEKLTLLDNKPRTLKECLKQQLIRGKR